MSFMERELKFKATKAAYKNKLSRWGAQKREKVSHEAVSVDPVQARLDNGSTESDHGLDVRLGYLRWASKLLRTLGRPSDSSDLALTDALPLPGGGFLTTNSQYSSSAGSSIPISQVNVEDVSPSDVSSGRNPISKRILAPDEFIGFDSSNDGNYESQSLIAQLSCIIQSFVHAGGFAQDTVAESLEGLFVLYESQDNLSLLERVLSVDLLLFGSHSTLFRGHAQRFCCAAVRGPVAGCGFEGEMSVFSRAVLVTMEMQAIL